MVGERATPIVLILIGMVPPMAMGAKRRDQFFISKRSGQTDFLVDVLSLRKGGGRGASYIIKEANSRPGFGLVDKDGVLEMRRKGRRRVHTRWVGEAREGGDASKGCEVIREHAAERGLQ